LCAIPNPSPSACTQDPVEIIDAAKRLVEVGEVFQRVLRDQQNPQDREK